MKKKSIITMVAALALVGAIGVGSTLAYFTDNDAASNTVTMGHVDIDLKEKTGSGETETITDKGLLFENIVPGDVLLKNPIITVAEGSEDCYLRAKVVVEGLDADHVADLFANDNINIEENWIKSGDYYYYQSVVEAGTPVSLFTTVTIPTKWGNEVAKEDFTISITAEAIQADNFNPDLDDNVIIGWSTSDGTDVTVENYDEVIGTREEDIPADAE